ncbi:hypothetical protein JWG42_18075, partial [Desulfoprunum benzoelyticum]|uniref:hypothetical protein n=1 Tax=Desulfoprunum benzoelyticum TaxID=1506996 RepID=UPI001964EA7B
VQDIPVWIRVDNPKTIGGSKSNPSSHHNALFGTSPYPLKRRYAHKKIRLKNPGPEGQDLG